MILREKFALKIKPWDFNKMIPTDFELSFHLAKKKRKGNKDIVITDP